MSSKFNFRFIRLTLVLALIIGSFGLVPVATAEAINDSASNNIVDKENNTISESDLINNNTQLINASPESSSNRDDCSGVMWTKGSLEPEIAGQVEMELGQIGISATIEARGYGETDSCGVYTQYGVDFTINLATQDPKNPSIQQVLSENILPILSKHGKPNLGNVTFKSPQGEIFPINTQSESLNVSQLDEALPADAINKNVYVIVYDPLLSNGQTLSQYRGWNDHATITQQTIDFFKQASNNKINYVIVETTIETTKWPEFEDGYSYTEEEYLAVLAGQQSPHNPSTADYNKLVSIPEFDICNKANRGEIDEVWVYNAPYFGIYESRLVGPGAYLYNSPPITNDNNCTRLIPIMGPSYERSYSEAVHNFTHRTEATMEKVYGSWSENRTNHNWDRFGLIKLQSPSYTYSGCGSSHYPPNAIGPAYDYDTSVSTLSNCDDFANYPNLGDPIQIVQPVGCADWGCNATGYYEYWFNHIPAFQGCGADNISNDWWIYITDPAAALSPSSTCPSDNLWITGNAGALATLSYSDGISKAIMTDGSGNYSIAVSNNWSGTVVPSRLGYTFSPVSRSYTNVVSSQASQNYTQSITNHTISGNAGIGGATLSYMEGTTLKTVITNGDGSYVLTVPHNWSGSVTPTHAEYAFSPTSRSYSNVTSDQVAENYIATYTGLMTISGNTGAGGTILYYTGIGIQGQSAVFTVG